MAETEINADELADLEGMLQECLITRRGEYRNSLEQIVTIIAMRFIQDHDKLPFRMIETWLSKHNGLGLHLVARPIEELIDGKSDQQCALIKVGSNKGREFPFYVYPICGNHRRQALLDQLMFTSEANLENLEHAGFPYPKVGTALSGEMNAKNN